MPDPADPRGAYRRRRRPVRPPGMVPDPPTVNATFGAPRDDTRPWWRLQAGQPGRLATLHGGTCVDWPPGRHPQGWRFLTRPQARAALDQGDAEPCSKCRPWISL